MSDPWEETAEMLTQQALQAAEEGRWGRVAHCYQERAELFRENDVVLSPSARMHMLDGHVQDRLRMAMMTVQHLLGEVASKQRLIKRFDTDTEPDVSIDRAQLVSRRT